MAVPAQAQPYHDQYDYNDSNSTSVGDVVVTAPRRGERSESGFPIERVSTSRVVHFDDLDLSTRWGVHELRVRVERAARDACDELDQTAMGNPEVADDPPCVQTAVQRAMDDAPILYHASYRDTYQGDRDAYYDRDYDSDY